LHLIHIFDKINSVTDIINGCDEMLSPIGIDDFLKSYKENNPKEDVKSLRKTIITVVEAKKNGAVCIQCEQPILTIGSAIVGWSGCFTCVTDETDSSEDYEIGTVC
jgi:hypothetical protein